MNRSLRGIWDRLLDSFYGPFQPRQKVKQALEKKGYSFIFNSIASSRGIMTYYDVKTPDGEKLYKFDTFNRKNDEAMKRYKNDYDAAVLECRQN